MKTKAEQIYVNSILQGCIQEWLDNPPVTTYDALNAAFRRKFDQLEKETQRLINPQPRKPGTPKPKAAAPAVDTGSVKAVYDVDTSNLNRRGRR